MSKFSTPVIIGLLTAGALALGRHFYNLNDLSQRLQTRFIKARLNKAGLRDSSIDTDIELINPTNGSISVKGLRGTVSAGGRTFAYFTGDKPFTIKPQSSVKITLRFVISSLELLTLSVDSYERKEIPSFDVKYFIRTRFGSIPQEYKFNPKEIL
jgi:LEA14-like dessication related protein